MSNGICNYDGCQRQAISRGLCSTHYGHARKNGLAKQTSEQRFWKKVNKTPSCWMWTGAVLQDSKYGVIRWDGKVQPAHRVSWLLAGNAAAFVDDEIDHICHNRLCVNPNHLRLVTRKQNVENHQGALRTNRLGIRGVHRVNNRFRAEMRHNGQRIHVGYFDTAELAGEAVRLKRIELFTHNDQDRHCPRP